MMNYTDGIHVPSGGCMVSNDVYALMMVWGLSSILVLAAVVIGTFICLPNDASSAHWSWKCRSMEEVMVVRLTGNPYMPM